MNGAGSKGLRSGPGEFSNARAAEVKLGGDGFSCGLALVSKSALDWRKADLGQLCEAFLSCFPGVRRGHGDLRLCCATPVGVDKTDIVWPPEMPQCLLIELLHGVADWGERGIMSGCRESRGRGQFPDACGRGFQGGGCRVPAGAERWRADP